MLTLGLMQTLSARLHALREDAGISARLLSELAGLSHTMVTRLENEDRPRPSGATIALLARVLGCSGEYLLFGLTDRPTCEQVRAAVANARAARLGMGTKTAKMNTDRAVGSACPATSEAA